MLVLNVCSLLKGVVEGEYARGLINHRLSRLYRDLRRLCLLDKAISKLVGDSGIYVSELPEDIMSRFKALVLGGLGGYDVRSSLAYLARVLFGLKVVDRFGKVYGIDELIKYLRSGEVIDLRVIKEGGVCTWLCNYLPKVIKDFINHVRSSLCINSIFNPYMKCKELSYAEAIKVIKESIPEPGEEAKSLSKYLLRLRESVANVLPGIDEFLTYSTIMKFTPIAIIREYVSECFSVKGRELISKVKEVLRPASPAIMDLSKCTIYSSIDEVPPKDVLKSNYLITTYRRVIKKEVRIEGNYDIVSEEVINSPTYALLTALTSDWVELEDIVYGTNVVARLLQRFIEDNIPKEVLNDPLIRRLLEEVLRLGEVKVVSELGKDRFGLGDIALIMKASPLVTSGLLEVSTGWDGVKFGNVIINRYSVRFRASRVAMKLGMISELLLRS